MKETFTTKDGRLTITYDGREIEPRIELTVNPQVRDLLALSSFSGEKSVLFIENF